MTDAPIPMGTWRIGGGVKLALDRPHLIGVVNATPDSFSDGGRYGSVDALSGHALRLVEEGASIVDVGGESTRPGADRVGAQEQIDRVVPVVEAIRASSSVSISIDTTLAPVAAAALDAGAGIVNDVSAGREDEGLLPLVAKRGAGLIVMHRRVPPDLDRYSPEYERDPEYADVVLSVRDFLLDAARTAEASGVPAESIAVDPGLGFGKSIGQNFDIIARSAEIAACGYPVVSAASRKSFIGAVTGVEVPRDRVSGSTAVSVVHYLAGARLFRVHDVAAHREALLVCEAIRGRGDRSVATSGGGSTRPTPQPTG